jgi:hypothetical protein
MTMIIKLMIKELPKVAIAAILTFMSLIVSIKQFKTTRLPKMSNDRMIDFLSISNQFTRSFSLKMVACLD